MSLMYVSKEIGRKIILQFSGYHELDKNSVYKLLMEYESAQIIKRTIVKDKKTILSIVDNKFKDTMEKYKNNALAIIIGKSLKFIEDFPTLRNILVLNKSYNELLKNKIYKNALSSPKINNQIRSEIWKLVLIIPGLIEEYEKIKSTKLKEYLESISEGTELIKLDVIRSFHYYSNEDQQVCFYIS